MTWIEGARAITDAATGRHDPCTMCDGDGPWPVPWVVVDDIKGDGHWDDEFHVVTEGGEGSHLATFEYRPHAELFVWARNVMPAMLDALEAAEARLACRSCSMCATDPPMRAALARVREQWEADRE